MDAAYGISVFDHLVVGLIYSGGVPTTDAENWASSRVSREP